MGESTSDFLVHGLVPEIAVVLGGIASSSPERREVFYWAAVLATFALGTAAGDLTAVTFGLGYFGSGLMFAAIIALFVAFLTSTEIDLPEDQRERVSAATPRRPISDHRTRPTRLASRLDPARDASHFSSALHLL